MGRGRGRGSVNVRKVAVVHVLLVFSRGWERANPGAVTPAFNPPEPGFSLDSIYQSGLDWARSGFDCARLNCARTQLDFPIIPMLVRFEFLVRVAFR